jgi:hypothetical protein
MIRIPARPKRIDVGAPHFPGKVPLFGVFKDQKHRLPAKFGAIPLFRSRTFAGFLFIIRPENLNQSLGMFDLF